MWQPAHRAPTPAAVLTYVALGTWALTCVLLGWNDDLDQAGSGEYAWPLDPVLIVRSALAWALPVTLMCAVVWVATVRQSRLGRRWWVPGVVVGGVVVWCGMAWASLSVSYQLGGWYVPWPGPVAGATYVADPTDYLNATLAARPGILSPVAVVLAVVATAWSAVRSGRATSVGPPTPARGARRTALAVLGAPALAAVATATLLQVPHRRVRLDCCHASSPPSWSRGLSSPWPSSPLSSWRGLGRAGWVLLSLVVLASVGPLVARWWSGEADSLLATIRARHPGRSPWPPACTRWPWRSRAWRTPTARRCHRPTTPARTTPRHPPDSHALRPRTPAGPCRRADARTSRRQTNLHRWSAVPLSSHSEHLGALRGRHRVHAQHPAGRALQPEVPVGRRTAAATAGSVAPVSVVEIARPPLPVPSTASSLPVCWLRTRSSPSVPSVAVHRWSRGAGVDPLHHEARRRPSTCRTRRARRPLLRFCSRRAPVGTTRQRLSAAAVVARHHGLRALRGRVALQAQHPRVCTLRTRWVPSPASTSVHRWSAVPVSPHCRTRAPSAVDMFSTPSTLLLCTLRSLRASPSTTSTQSWSAVPLSPHCSARPPSAVDMPLMPSTRPLATFTRR